MKTIGEALYDLGYRDTWYRGADLKLIRVPGGFNPSHPHDAADPNGTTTGRYNVPTPAQGRHAVGFDGKLISRSILQDAIRSGLMPRLDYRLTDSINYVVTGDDKDDLEYVGNAAGPYLSVDTEWLAAKEASMRKSQGLSGPSMKKKPPVQVPDPTPSPIPIPPRPIPPIETSPAVLTITVNTSVTLLPGVTYVLREESSR